MVIKDLVAESFILDIILAVRFHEPYFARDNIERSIEMLPFSVVLSSV